MIKRSSVNFIDFFLYKLYKQRKNKNENDVTLPNSSNMSINGLKLFGNSFF